MGPVRGTMVQTADLCAEVGEASCPGWALDGGIEVRCTNPIHHERLVGTEAACLAAGISYRRLDHWIMKGWIEADPVHPGSGRPRRMTEHEVAVARLMARLVQSGVQPPTSARLARHLWDGEEARLTDALVIAWQRDEEGTA